MTDFQLKNNYKCLECGLTISNKNYAISRHVKKHNLSFIEYIVKYYKKISGNIEKCGFCENNAIPNYDINHENKTYSINYENGYFCRTIECKQKISMNILGHEYISKKFEKIGSKTEYLKKLYKIDTKSAKKLKFKLPKIKFKYSLNEFKEKYGDIEGEIRYNKRKELISKNNARNKFPCTLENFINKYGNDIGSKKYKERCEKISYTSSKDFFIKKHGQEEGEKIWKNKYKLIKRSNKSLLISKLLDNLNIKYEFEKNINSKFVDYYLTEYKIVIEYFGDYWHANPKRFESTYYNSQLKSIAKDIWEKDKIRLKKIQKNVDSIIIIWESSIINETLLENIINNIKNKKIIMYI